MPVTAHAHWSLRPLAALALLCTLGTARADCAGDLAQLAGAYPDLRPAPTAERRLWETKHLALTLDQDNRPVLCHALVEDLQRQLRDLKRLDNLRPPVHYDQDARKPVTDIEHLFRASDIIGSPVINTDDETLGIIEAVTLDSETGRIRYVVMDSGGLLSPQSRPVAVTWNRLDWIESNGVFVLDTSRESLRQAPAIGEHDWPGSADDGWLARGDDSVQQDRSRQRPAE